jgi:hypothetical protein
LTTNIQPSAAAVPAPGGAHSTTHRRKYLRLPRSWTRPRASGVSTLG